MEKKKWTIDGNKLFSLICEDVEINGVIFSRIKEYMEQASLCTHEGE